MAVVSFSKYTVQPVQRKKSKCKHLPNLAYLDS